MTKQQIEMWALRVIDAVKFGRPNEDSTVEMKAEWPEPQSVARRIAAHANAARGEPILWLIGVDEKKGVLGVQHEELSNWFAKIKSQFDAVAPPLTDLNILADGVWITALLFETDRAPFVVKNPEGGKIQFEVPWREGASTRSANRADILRLLSPIQNLPSIQVLEGSLTVRQNQTPKRSADQEFAWYLLLKLYIVPSNEARLVIPFHQCNVNLLDLPTYQTPIMLHGIGINPDSRLDLGRGRTVVFSQTVSSTPAEVLISGPGVANLSANGLSRAIEVNQLMKTDFTCDLLPAGAERPVTISKSLLVTRHNTDQKGHWVLDPTSQVTEQVTDNQGGIAEVIKNLDPGINF